MGEALSLGDTFPVWILSCNATQRELVVSQKQPRQTIETFGASRPGVYELTGVVVEGVVGNLTNFGAYVEVAPGVSALAVNTTLKGYLNSGYFLNHASQVVSTGMPVKVRVRFNAAKNKLDASGIWLVETPRPASAPPRVADSGATSGTGSLFADRAAVVRTPAANVTNPQPAPAPKASRTTTAEGPTVEDAIQVVLKTLGVELSKVKIEIIDKGERGFLNRIKRNAQVQGTTID